MRIRLCLIWLALAISQTCVGQQYPFLLVPNSPKDISRLFEDSRGRLWLSAFVNLFCFDGSRFYSLNDLGIFGGEVLTEDAEGGIWISAKGVLYRFFDGRAEQIMKGYARSAVRVGADTVLVSMGPADRNLDAWLMRIQKRNGVWKAERVMDLHDQGTLTVDHHGMLLYACHDAWCEARLEDIQSFHPGKPLSITKHPIADFSFGDSQILRDQFGCVWARRENTASYQCPGDIGPKNLPREIVSEGTARISEMADGKIVLQSNNSLAIGRPGAFKVAGPKNGLPTPADTVSGRDGTIWIANAGGLYRLPSPFRLEYWTAQQGLETTTSITRTGGRMFAASGDGISALSPDRTRWVPLSLSLPFGQIWHLLRAKDDTVWGVAPTGLVELGQDGKTIAQSSGGRWGAHLAQTADGQMWMSGYGVSRVKRVGRILVAEPQHIPEPLQNGLDIRADSKNGQLWACYAGGLTTLEGASWRTFTTKDGLRDDACRSIAIHPNGGVWFAYNMGGGFGLIREEKQHLAIKPFYQYTEDVGQPEAVFFDSDSRGWLWRAPHGVAVYVTDAAQAENGVWLPLTEVDGLPALNAGERSFFGDSDGTVWWAAGSTVIHFNPQADFVRPTSVPLTFISGYSISGSRLPGQPRLAEMVKTVAHGSDVTAHIGTLQYDRRSALRFRYRLDSEPWKDYRQFDVKLGVLSWGRHTLAVQGRIFTGPWSAVQASSFEVLKPLWLTWPFLLAFASGSLAAGAGTYRWRRKQSERRRKAFPNLAEWRLNALSPEGQELVDTTLDGRYQVENILAQGGFATVFKGRDLRELSRLCAIKVFRRELSAEWLARRFKQEVSALEQIQHRNVVRIYGHGTTPSGVNYLVMEFIEGKTLREVLDGGGLPPQQIASYLRQAAGALDEIHSRGICHRDLKPENFMIRLSGRPEEELVLIDFSIAIVKEPDQTMHGLSRAAGTIYYMAPEQAIGYATPATDIYSLAKIIVEMLTGFRLSFLLPNASMDLPERVREFLTGSSFGLSPESIELISSALLFDPAHRPQNASVFANQIALDLARG